jgi:hypothetical protein
MSATQMLRNKRNDEIIKMVLIEDYSNLSGDQIDTICSKIPKGNKQDSCYDQLDGTKSSGKSDSVTSSYWKAVSKGYEGTIDEFSKRKDTLSKILGIGVEAGGFLSGLIGSNNTDATTEITQQGLSRGAKIGIAFGVVSVLGVIGYLIYKNNK